MVTRSLCFRVQFRLPLSHLVLLNYTMTHTPSFIHHPQMSKFNFSMELSGGLQHLFDGEKEMEVSMEVNSEDEIKVSATLSHRFPHHNQSLTLIFAFPYHHYHHYSGIITSKIGMPT